MTRNSRKLADDCFVHDKDRLWHDEALSILREQMRAVPEVETIPIEHACGRNLAKPVIAPRNIPAFNNSAVDGYAFAHADHDPTGGFFPLGARIAAGETNVSELPAFSAARIFTGAPMPPGADTVAMQEDCEPHTRDDGQFIEIPNGLKKGANCRLAGEDVTEGEIVAAAGNRLRPQDLAAIASTGTDRVEVYKPLKIALLSSGDEVLRPGEPFETGKVYDANFFMLKSMLDHIGSEVTDFGVRPDDAGNLKKIIRQAAETHNVIISTGGASKGEEDHFIDTLDEIGKRHLWQLAVKPGRPMCFGQIEETLCFTLPGNPVAAFVCFLLYVRPSLMALGGSKWQEPQRYPLTAGFSIRSKPDRREFLRGYLVKSSSGETLVEKFNRDGSGLITGLRESSGLIEIPEETTSVSRGDIVKYIPYSELGIL